MFPLSLESWVQGSPKSQMNTPSFCCESEAQPPHLEELEGTEQAASHKSQLSRRSLGTRVYSGEAKPLPSASLANSQGSAEPQAHGFGCLTPARAGQEGKGETAGKFTVIQNPKTTLVLSVLFRSTMSTWVKASKTPASITGPTSFLPFKRTATSKRA